MPVILFIGIKNQKILGFSIDVIEGLI